MSYDQIYAPQSSMTDDASQITLAIDSKRRHLYFMKSSATEGESVIRRLDFSSEAIQKDDWSASMPPLQGCQDHLVKNELDLVGR